MTSHRFYRLRRSDAPAQRIRSRHTYLHGLAGRRNFLQAFELFHCSQPVRRAYFPRDFIFSALVMREWPKATWRMWSRIDAFQPAIKRQVEVVPRLLAVSDQVEPGGNLVVHGDNHGIIAHFFDVSLAELIEVS